MDGLKQLLIINPMENHITKRNTTLENITDRVNNKMFLCQNEKLHPLTARRGKCI